ncbi:MAG: low affinity iron permease family protein, partial [Acidobacteria bacterium]|nr:low affinity iron permease family protein [Acidobacteriota bacterium]
LDELIRALAGAHNSLLDAEELPIEELDSIRLRYERLAQQPRNALNKGRRGGAQANNSQTLKPSTGSASPHRTDKKQKNGKG